MTAWSAATSRPASPSLQHLPLVTHNGHELNAEAILDLRPSVVLTDYSIGPLEVQLQLKDAGIPIVIMSDQRSRDAIGPQIQAVADGARRARPSGSSSPRASSRDVDGGRSARSRRSRRRDTKQRLRMVFLYIRGNAGVYYWFGKGSGADDLIDELGGVDVATEAGLEGIASAQRRGPREGRARPVPDDVATA